METKIDDKCAYLFERTKMLGEYKFSINNSKRPIKDGRYKAILIDGAISKQRIVIMKNKKFIKFLEEDWINEGDINILAEYVRRFYRYGSSKNEDGATNQNLYIDEIGFSFLHLIAGNDIDSKSKMALIAALCQSGKTFLVIAAIHIYLALGFTPILLVPIKSHIRQFNKRYQLFSKKLVKHLKDNNLASKSELDMFDGTLTVNSTGFKNAINGTKPKTVIVIKHFSHIEKINNNLTEDSKICLFIDEAQITGGYKVKDPNYADPKVKFDTEIAKLKDVSTKYIVVSATVQDIIQVDGNLYSDNIIYIRPNSDYLGSEQFIWKNFDTVDDDETDLLPTSILRCLREQSLKEPIERYDRRHKKYDLHPINGILRYERVKDEMSQILQAFIDGSFGKTITKGNWAIITDYGDGFHIWHKSLEGNSKLTIENVVGEKKKNGAFFFPSEKIGIDDVYQYFASGGIAKFPRILTIAYDMCKESTSFISHYDKPENIHLTFGVVKFSKTTPVATKIQVLGRLNGNHGDDIRPVIYSTIQDRKDYINGMYLQDRFLSEFVNTSMLGNIKITQEILDSIRRKIQGKFDTPVICASHLEKVEVCSNRVPKHYNRVKGIKIHKITNPNKKKEEKIMNFDVLNTLDIYEELMPEVAKEMKDKLDNIEENKPSKPRVKEKVEYKKETEDVKKIDGVDLHKLKDWFREDCELLIARMLKFLYKQSKPISIEEFKKGIKYDGKDFTSNILNGRALKSKYGMVWKVADSMVNLNPKVRSYLNKV